MEKRKSIVLITLSLIVIILVPGYLIAANFINLSSTFDTIKNNNGLVIVYHPGRYDKPTEWYSQLYDSYNDTIIGLEVFNKGDNYSEDRFLWDAINLNRTPYNYIWGFSDDDMHRRSHLFRNYQHFPMESLSEENLRQAMLDGAFYFSYEPDGANETSPTFGVAETPKLTNVSINGDSIEIDGTNFDKICWYNDETENIINASIINTNGIDSTFVRAILINDKGKTLTQPFGLYQNKIFNPYENVNWDTAIHYKGNFHTHTTQSDGDMDPDVVIEYYNNASYDILAITDHNKNTWSWSKWLDYSPAETNSSSEFYPDLSMLAISGNEASATHHFGSLFNDYDGNGMNFWLPGQEIEW
jgi:hypothetical protein